MKLYFKPGACSLASHIVLRETGAEFELEQVDTAAQKTASGEDFSAINPKGYVPALRLDDGEILTEGAAVLQFLADRAPEAGLAPAAGTIERARLQEHLNFVASELHQAFGPFFGGQLSDEARRAAEAKVARRMDHFETLLADGRPFLLGETFTVADAYLFVVASWANFTGIGLDTWPRVAAFVERVAARPKVREAMVAEGLIEQRAA